MSSDKPLIFSLFAFKTELNFINSDGIDLTAAFNSSSLPALSCFIKVISRDYSFSTMACNNISLIILYFNYAIRVISSFLSFVISNQELTIDHFVPALLIH